ncbi:hypothetical protein K7432_003695 [Basidiobolus ranarum]|uniref:Uncharacterized protein n=1 Tax=Basidiobolus ranarum TaxID=34480 RepID=A0ABR2W5Z9_9FUNG
MTHIEVDTNISPSLEASTEAKSSEQRIVEGDSKVSSPPSLLSSSHSLISASSVSPRNPDLDQQECWQDTHSYPDDYSDENRKLRQELEKYRAKVNQLETKLLEKNSTSSIDIRSLVQKTLQAALLEKERHKREAEKERHRREEVEVQLAQLQVKQEQEVAILRDKEELIQVLQNQLMESIQDIDHLQQLNEETTNLLRHLHSQIPDFFLQSNQNEEDKGLSESTTAKFTLDKFIYKVVNLINESHQMVDKILELQTKHEQLANQLDTSNVYDQGELNESEEVSGRSSSLSSRNSDYEDYFQENCDNSTKSQRVLTESPFSLEDEEVRNHLSLSCQSNAVDPLTSRSRYSHIREADVEVVMDNLHHTQKELFKIQENLIELEENGTALQLELEEITTQRDELMEELRKKDEELRRVKLFAASNAPLPPLSAEKKAIDTIRCEDCKNPNAIQELQKSNGKRQSNSDATGTNLQTEALDCNSLDFQDLNATYSHLQCENTRLSQMIQQKTLEFLKQLNLISGLHRLGNSLEHGSLETDTVLPIICNQVPHIEPKSVLPTQQQTGLDFQVVPTFSSLRISPEPISSLDHSSAEQRAVREEMDMIIESLEMLHLE